MKKILSLIAVLVPLLVLNGCTSSGIRVESTTTYSIGNTTITEKRVAQSTTASKTSKPSLVTLPPSEFKPVVMGTKTTTDKNGNIVTEPVVGVSSTGGAANVVGAASSITEIAQDLLKWPIIIGFLLIAAGAICFFAVPGVNKKISISAAIAGGAVVGLAYGLAAYPWIAAAFGIVVFLGLCVYVLYKLRINHNALVDTVGTVEYLKDEVLTPQQKKENFDKPQAPVPLMQTEKTKEVINTIREDTGLKT